MDRYHKREDEMRRKELERGGAAYLLMTLGLMAAFVPVALVTVGSLRAYKKIREVMKK